jgi:TetR/AcrR family transcriptional regulator
MPRMRAQQRRRQLLEVAASLFSRLGYRGTTTAELAKAAGITEPILYRHFENKLDLFVTLVDEVGREVIAGWQKALDGVNDPRKRLEILLAGNPATHERGRSVYRVIFQAMTEAEGDRSIARAIRKHVSKLHKFVAGELASLQAAAAIRRDEPPADLAWLLMNVAVGYGLMSPLGLGRNARGKLSMERLLTDLVSPSQG